MNRKHFLIHIADDNPLYLEVMAARLRSDQTQVSCFKTGASLLEAMVDMPDLVIADHFFGDRGEGLEILRHIKANHPTTRVILISGQQDIDFAIEVLKSGAADYLEKNGDELDALVASVDRIVEAEMSSRNRSNGITERVRKLARKSFFQRQSAIFFAMLLLLTTGCQTLAPKVSPLAGDIQSLPIELTTPVTHRIQPDDKVSLSIWNNDDLSVGSVFGIYNSNEVYGKWVLVDEFGDVSLPLLGTVHLSGKTTTEAATLLKEAYSKEVRDPVIVVRVLNREVTVTGEVLEPGNFILDKEKNTFAEVLGKAEGLTDYAKLKKVTLTRKKDGQLEVYSLNLRKMTRQDLSSLIVMRGDVIHVPERAGKRVERKMPLLIPLASLMTSIGVLISVSGKN